MAESTDRSSFASGLGLDGLNPPQIGVFVRSVPRRVDEALAAVRERADAHRKRADDGDDLSDLDAVDQKAVHLTDQVADELDGAAAFVPTGGAPAPSTGRPSGDDARSGRVRAAAEVLTARLDRLGSGDWSDRLLDELRTAVARVAEPLRHLEALPEELPALDHDRSR